MIRTVQIENLRYLLGIRRLRINDKVLNARIRFVYRDETIDESILRFGENGE